MSLSAKQYSQVGRVVGVVVVRDRMPHHEPGNGITARHPPPLSHPGVSFSFRCCWCKLVRSPVFRTQNRSMVSSLALVYAGFMCAVLTLDSALFVFSYCLLALGLSILTD